jgi:hypothetical protein
MYYIHVIKWTIPERYVRPCFNIHGRYVVKSAVSEIDLQYGGFEHVLYEAEVESFWNYLDNRH